MAQKPLKPKATRPLMPKYQLPRPFDPDRTRPVPDNPSFELGPVLEPEPTPLPYSEQQRYLAPSRRDNPVRDYCKGGKVISSYKGK